MLSLLIGGAAAAAGYRPSFKFVRDKLRYATAVRTPAAPAVAGVAAVVVAAPVVALLPVIGAGTAIMFGAGVAAGVAHANSVRNKA